MSGPNAPHRDAPRVSVVIPVLNDAAALAALLVRLSARLPDNDSEAHGPSALEVIVVDGGSLDESAQVASAYGAEVVRAAPGRGGQLADGIDRARGDWLWLLHADSEPSAEALAHLLGRSGTPAWGRFSVSLEDSFPMKTIAYMMNLRSRLTAICTGDQGIFVHRTLLDAIGGMPRQPLMEDIELSRRLKRLQPPDCRPERIGTSPRRWRRDGILRTVLAMWAFRLRYWLGADAVRLAREYYRS
ncbi:MAG TPA: TIGR04283 family arsenosugar biosynthesis glycosyltransferase [Pseudomonadales bacterium]